MSLTVEQLLIDAKKLANRLKDDESKADTLITRAKSTHNHVEAMKQYTEDVEKLNEAASQRPHSVLVAGLKRESQHMRELRAENRELRIALADYQNSVKLIMSKYRQQISQLLKVSKVEMSSMHNSNCSHYSQVILDQCTKIDKMRRVMKEALSLMEEYTSEDFKIDELVSRLMTENKGLREIINIYNQYGNHQQIFEGKDVDDNEKIKSKEQTSQKEELNEKLNQLEEAKETDKKKNND